MLKSKQNVMINYQLENCSKLKMQSPLAIVDKQSEIYFVDNVKFHLDSVVNLGTFIEIEAIDRDDTLGKDKLQEQCNYYLKLFAIKESDLIA